MLNCEDSLCSHVKDAVSGCVSFSSTADGGNSISKNKDILQKYDVLR